VDRRDCSWPGDPVPEGPKTEVEVEAQIELGKLLAPARAGREPDSGVTVAGWDVSTEEANLGYIRGTIKPALGIKEVRKVRGQLLDTLYARLQKCGELVVLPVRRAVQAQPLVVVRLGVLTPTGVGVLALLG
jgi:hypothetical protein